MDRLLFERALRQKIRRAGGRAGKNKKRTAKDDESFAEQLEFLLRQSEETEETQNNGSNI
jgi:uncharacterized protein